MTAEARPNRGGGRGGRGGEGWRKREGEEDHGTGSIEVVKVYFFCFIC